MTTLRDHLLEEIKFSKDGRRTVDTHIVLDTFRKEPSESYPERGIISWNLAINGPTSEDRLGVRHPLQQVSEIEIKEFTMPIPDPVKYTFGSTIDGYTVLKTVTLNSSPATMTTPQTDKPFESPLAQSPYDKHITLYIKETGMQSISDIAGRRHNFDLRLMSFDILGTSDPMIFNMCQAVPKQEIIRFADPLTDITRITLEFKNPDTPIRLMPDCYYGVDVRMVASGTSPTDTTVGVVYNLTIFIRDFCISNGDDLGLTENDRIYISGFATNNVSLNRYMNSPDGLLIGKNITDPVTNFNALYSYATSGDIYAASNCFVLNPNITGTVTSVTSSHTTLPFWFPPQRVTVYIPKRRIRIPMRFQSSVRV